MIPRRLWLIVGALVVVAVFLAVTGLWRYVTAPLAALTAALGLLVGAIGGDRQTPDPGRPRRGGVGGSPTEEGDTSDAEDSTPADGQGADRPPRRNRPRRPGF